MKTNVFNEVKNSIDIKSTVIKLLPNGKHEANEWVALNPIRQDSNLGSFRIDLTSGKWIDFATSDKGGDVISLYAYLTGRNQFEAAKYLSGGNWENQKSTRTLAKVAKVAEVNKNTNQYINKLWNESFSPRLSVVETYLRNRGYNQAIPSIIRFHPNLYHKPSAKSYQAMLAGITKCSSDSDIVGLHRTYLKADGTGKADIEPNKMMFGRSKGGAVMLTPPASTLVIAEGIETALSVFKATNYSTWAALSTSGLINIEVPPPDITHRIIIAADGDEAGITAANKLATRLVEEGYKVSIAASPTGTDFNDLLRGTR